MRQLVLLLLLLAPMPLLACDVMLSNASDVDVGLMAHERHIILGPGQTQLVPLLALANLEFGAMAHEFKIEAVRATLCSPGTPIGLEARQDGSLWFRVGPQPKGFPLQPVSRQDLTAAPPNSAFKPNSCRSTNSMAGTACHAVCSATRVGLT